MVMVVVCDRFVPQAQGTSTAEQYCLPLSSLVPSPGNGDGDGDGGYCGW